MPGTTAASRPADAAREGGLVNAGHLIREDHVEYLDHAEIGAGELSEQLLKVNRCAAVVKGGRFFSFSGLTVVGNRAGVVGYGFEARGVPAAIEKAKDAGTSVPSPEGTILHEVIGEFVRAGQAHPRFRGLVSSRAPRWPWPRWRASEPAVEVDGLDQPDQPRQGRPRRARLPGPRKRSRAGRSSEPEGSKPRNITMTFLRLRQGHQVRRA